MRTRSLSGRLLAVTLFAFITAAGPAAQAAAQSATPLPTRKPVLQVNLKTNEPYYLETFKGDIDRLESGLSAISPQKVKLSSKDKLNIITGHDRYDTVPPILRSRGHQGRRLRRSQSDLAI